MDISAVEITVVVATLLKNLLCFITNVMRGEC